MKHRIIHPDRLHQRIARLFLYGTWLAAALIAAGILLTAIAPFYPINMAVLNGDNLTKLGIGIFILMPIIRVMLMLWHFLRERDPVYSVISAMVLATILTSALIH